MKEAYIAPDIQVEYYLLDQNIASNCHHVVDLGPTDATHHTVCEQYEKLNPDHVDSGVSINSILKKAPQQHNITFYNEDNCDCYYSAGEGYWTS